MTNGKPILYERDCFFVLYQREGEKYESQETFHITGRDPMLILKMAYEFAEEMKKETGKPVKILFSDRTTKVPKSLINQAIKSSVQN